MGCGRTPPKGYLPVFSVDSEEEAQTLIALACPLGYNGKYFARELAVEQTLENLEAFSTKLDQAHDHMVQSGRCTCKEPHARDVGFLFYANRQTGGDAGNV